MAASFFLPADDDHDVFSLFFMHGFDGALCSFVGEVLFVVVVVVVDNGLHHSRATSLNMMLCGYSVSVSGRLNQTPYHLSVYLYLSI